ncbi:MAG TPA: hypothetical protein VGO43_00325, partial [Pyrinomonadaceae bacterium]|nr:hypothetical protein [Pyrinomonadaceae bacterium]
LGALGSYTLSYNNEDLAIALLTPEAKFIRQFVPTTNVAELLAGPGGLYVSTGEAITLYDADGTADGFFATSERPDAFTVDNAGNFYIIANNSVAKYTPLRKF